MSLITTLTKKVLGEDKAANGRPGLDAVLEQMDGKLANFSALVPPDPTSRPRTPFGGSPTEAMSLRQSLRALPIFLPLLAAMRRSARYYEEPFQPAADEATPEFLAELEAKALRAGATAIRYVRVPPHAIFQDKGLPYPYAVVFTVEMARAPLASAPSYAAMAEVMKGYRQLALIANRLARFMRRHGFAAYPGTALGGITDYPHLAELAGLGAIGYHGLLVTPHDGARLRLNTIYTNISNLPLQHENEHSWVRDLCAMCGKCIRECPVDAIFAQPRPRGDGGMQTIDHDACRDYFVANYGCAVCLAICPFSQHGYEKVRRRFKGNPTAPQFRIPAGAPS